VLMRFFPSITTITTTTITTSTTSTTVTVTSAIIITTTITTLPSSPSPTITNYQPTTNRPTTGYCDLPSSTLRLSFNPGNDDTHRVNSTITKFAIVRKMPSTARLSSWINTHMPRYKKRIILKHIYTVILSIDASPFDCERFVFSTVCRFETDISILLLSLLLLLVLSLLLLLVLSLLLSLLLLLFIDLRV